MTTEPRRLAEIDVLRGLAALTVVFSHYNPHWDRFLEEIPVLVPNSFGHDAVLLFFVISGFVIFMSIEKCQTVLDFAALRFSRLYPAYWATLIFSSLLTALLFGKNVWLPGVVVNLSMFQEFAGYPNVDNVYWSLTVELAFYLNVAWLFALGLHRRRKMLVAVWLASSAVWALTVRDPAIETRGLLALLFAFDFSAYFSIGIVFFDAMKHGWSKARAMLIALAIFTAGLTTDWQGAALAALFAAIFALAIGGRLARLVSPITLWLGAISYSLYLIHRNIGYLALDWLHANQFGPIMGIAITTAGALALATIFTYAVERPSLRILRTAYQALRARASPAHNRETPSRKHSSRS